MIDKYRLTYCLTATLFGATIGCQPDDTVPTGPEAVSDPVKTQAPDLAVAAAGWVTRADMPGGTRTSVATAAVTKNGNSVLYVIGGRTSTGASLGRVQAYHVATNSWTWHTDLPVPLKETNGAATINNKIYVSGGQIGDHNWSQGLYVFDPGTNRWTRKRDLPAQTGGGMSAVSNNKLYVVTHCQDESCGAGGDPPLFYRYDPATDIWTQLPPPPNAHLLGAAGFIGGKLYVTGGLGIGDSRQLDVYDPATNQWSTRAPLGRDRWSVAGLAYQAKLYLIGGSVENADGSPSQVRATTVYNPATNTWSTGAPLPTARADIAGARVVLNGTPRIEVVGGPRPGNNLSYQP